MTSGCRGTSGRAKASSPVRNPRPEPPRPDPLAGSDPATFVYRDTGGAEEADEPETAEPGMPYGPDDPAYGPPSPDWYTREGEEEAGQHAAGEYRHTRGPFEPLRRVGETAGQPASRQETSFEDPDAPDGDDDHGDPGDRVLEQIRDLYMTAEAIGAESLDKHYEQLLERQRQLISEYFKEADAVDHSAGTGLSAVTGLEELSVLGSGNGHGGGRSSHLASGSDQRSPR